MNVFDQALFNDPFVIWTEIGPIRLPLQYLHSNKKCIRLLYILYKLKNHKKWWRQIAVQYIKTHLNCKKIAKFQGVGW